MHGAIEMLITLDSLHVSDDLLRAFCEKWQIVEFSLFGSVLREDFTEDSDLDILIDFEKDARWGLFDQVEMKLELEELFGRSVDLLTRTGLDASQNWIRKAEIMETAQTLDLLAA